MSTDNPILRISFQFSLDIIVFTELLEMKKKYCLANQLFRSGTSIGAQVRETQGSETRADFIHKMKLAYKEAEEARYWLELSLHSSTNPDPGKLLEDISIILRILGKIISTSKNG